MSNEILLSDNNELSSSDSDISLPDLKKLQPYDLEPLASSSDSSSDSDCETSCSVDSSDFKRIGNTHWCQCGNCRPMESATESLCCAETNDVPDELFEGNKCVVEAAAFQMVCLEKPVLETALAALNDLRGDKLELTNESYRYAGYKQFVWWVHSRLGKGVRKVIPSCAVWAIRDKHPSETNNYVAFKHSNDPK